MEVTWSVACWLTLQLLQEQELHSPEQQLHEQGDMLIERLKRTEVLWWKIGIEL